MKQKQIVIAEDSELLSALILDTLKKAGYRDIRAFKNGKLAYDHIRDMEDKGQIRKVGCLITDIEMPVMDGHHLIKLVREDKRLPRIPVMIFSSIVNDAVRKKGAELGADAQISKPQIGEMAEMLKQLLEKNKEG